MNDLGEGQREGDGAMETEAVVLPNTLSQDEWRCIVEFNRRAAELRASSVLEGASRQSAKMVWSATEGMKTEVGGLPEEEPFRSLLLTFRLFYANDEPSNLRRVLNILGKHCSDVRLREVLLHLRARWDQALFGGAMFLHVDGQPVTAARILDLWLNAHYFHGDQSKRLELEAISEAMTPDFAKYLLAEAVFESCRVVLAVHKMISTLRATSSAP